MNAILQAAWGVALAASFGASLQAQERRRFEVATVKASFAVVGHDGNVRMDPGRFSARNATLKRLIFEAWQVPYSQISGGPGWLDTDEFDIDAKVEGRADVEKIRVMLRELLVERFRLEVRREKKEGRIYALVVGKNGSKLPGLPEGGTWRFHGSLSEFCSVLAVQLTIPVTEDPSTPSRARGTGIPVVNRTGIDGEFDLQLSMHPEPGGDAFAMWQRALEEQLGLKLEAQKGVVEVLVIGHAERVPIQDGHD